MALHERLKQSRDRLGLTLQQVADRIGLSAPTISAYENAQREPSFSHLAKFAKLYCHPIEYFFSETAEPKDVVVWRVKPHSPTAEELEARLLELGSRFRELEVWAEAVHPIRLPQLQTSCTGVVRALKSRPIRFMPTGHRNLTHLGRTSDTWPHQPENGLALEIGRGQVSKQP